MAIQFESVSMEDAHKLFAETRTSLVRDAVYSGLVKPFMDAGIFTHKPLGLNDFLVESGIGDAIDAENKRRLESSSPRPKMELSVQTVASIVNRMRETWHCAAKVSVNGVHSIRLINLEVEASEREKQAEAKSEETEPVEADS